MSGLCDTWVYHSPHGDTLHFYSHSAHCTPLRAQAEEARALAAEIGARVGKAGGLSGAALAAEASELAKALESATIPATDRKELSAKVRRS